MESAIETETRHDKTRRILREHGYQVINSCKGPRGGTHSMLEFWSGPKGVLIAQLWDGEGVSTFAEWPLGSTYDQLEAAL